MTEQESEPELRESSEPSPLLNLAVVGSLPVTVLFSFILFTITEGGSGKFGIAILALIVILPLGALVSFAGSIYRISRFENEASWPNWLPRSRPLLILPLLLLVAVITVAIVAQGDLLKFYGMLLSWLIIWAVVYFLINYRVGPWTNQAVSRIVVYPVEAGNRFPNMRLTPRESFSLPCDEVTG